MKPWENALGDCLACGEQLVPNGGEGIISCPNNGEEWHNQLVQEVIARQYESQERGI
jgi:predicted RNA-binding Zn-ribbon protein involved in translation (DUF1610 family)